MYVLAIVCSTLLLLSYSAAFNDDDDDVALEGEFSDDIDSSVLFESSKDNNENSFPKNITPFENKIAITIRKAAPGDVVSCPPIKGYDSFIKEIPTTPKIWICLDREGGQKKWVPRHTSHSIAKNIKNKEKRASWKDRVFCEDNTDIVKDDDDIDQDSHNGDYSGDYYAFQSGHLAANADFMAVNSQVLTYSYCNARPIWNKLNNGAWKTAENQIRKAAGLIGSTEMEITSGTYGTLNRNNLAPTWFWKYYEPSLSTSVSYFGYNNPYESARRISSIKNLIDNLKKNKLFNIQNCISKVSQTDSFFIRCEYIGHRTIQQINEILRFIVEEQKFS